MGVILQSFFPITSNILCMVYPNVHMKELILGIQHVAYRRASRVSLWSEWIDIFFWRPVWLHHAVTCLSKFLSTLHRSPCASSRIFPTYGATPIVFYRRNCLQSRLQYSVYPTPTKCRNWRGVLYFHYPGRTSLTNSKVQTQCFCISNDE